MNVKFSGTFAFYSKQENQSSSELLEHRFSKEIELTGQPYRTGIHKDDVTYAVTCPAKYDERYFKLGQLPGVKVLYQQEELTDKPNDLQNFFEAARTAFQNMTK